MKKLILFFGLVVIFSGSIPVALAAPPAPEAKAYFVIEGVRYTGSVTITSSKRGPVCLTYYSGVMVLADGGQNLPVEGSLKTCGWTGPGSVEGYYVILGNGQTASLTFIP